MRLRWMAALFGLALPSIPATEIGSLYGAAAPATLLVSSNNYIREFDGSTGTPIGAVLTGGGLDNAQMMAIGPDGNLYVASARPPDTSVVRYNGRTGDLMGVFASGGGLTLPVGIAFGPDGNLYVGDYGPSDFSFPSIRRYNGTTGAPMGVFASGGGLINPAGIVFGPDGNLYVSNDLNGNSILRYNGSSGLPMPSTGNSGATFVSASSGGLIRPQGLTFGPDGRLYVSSYLNGKILRFDQTTGAFIDAFASTNLVQPIGLVFGPDGNLYVADIVPEDVVRFNGSTGVFIDYFVPTAKNAGLFDATYLIFINNNPPISTGTITVTTNLPAATFTITGPSTFTGSGTSFTQSNVPPGTYTITFNPLSGYIFQQPSLQTQTLAGGGNTSFSETYIAGQPSLSVSSPSLSFSYVEGSGGTQPQSLKVSSNGSQISFLTGIEVTTQPQWAFWNNYTGPTPHTFSISVNPNLPAGQYNTFLSFTAGARSSGISVPVSLDVISVVPPPPAHTLSFTGLIASRNSTPWTIDKTSLWTAFRQAPGDPAWPDGFLQNEWENIASSDDTCYAGTIDSLFQIATKQIRDDGLNALIQQIITMPLNFFPVESVLGNVLLQTGEFFISACGSAALTGTNCLTADNLSATAIDFAADQTLGYILPLAVGEYGRDVISAGLSTQDYASKLFNDDGATVAIVSGNNQGTTAMRSQLVPLTNTTATMAFNPWSRYVSVGARSDCGDGSIHNYLFLFQLAPKGGFLFPNTPTLVPNTMRKAPVPH